MPRKTDRMDVRQIRWALGVLTLAGLACSLLGTPAPTFTPPPTPSPTPFPPGGVTSTPVLAPTDLPPTATAQASAEPTTPLPTPPGGLDPADREDILILEPGPGASLIGSVHVSGSAEPTFEQNLVVQITGADGAVLTTVPTTIQADVGSAGPFAVDVAFAVPSDQPGRVSVFSASARDGGLLHLASVEVNLLASGPAVGAPAEPRAETHAIHVPAPQADISGGLLHVEGFSDYTWEANLVLVVCGEGGSGAPDLICGTADNVLATAVTTIAAPDIGQPGPYAADLPYAVSSPVSSRLVVYSTSARDGGLTHLSSVNVKLNP